MANREILFFLLNGFLSVALAYLFYSFLLYFYWSTEMASALAYVAGTVYGFWGNKKFAFKQTRQVTFTLFIRYIMLYSFTMLANVEINAFLLVNLSWLDNIKFIAFMSAIFCSTVLNFLGLKFWVFIKAAD